MYVDLKACNGDAPLWGKSERGRVRYVDLKAYKKVILGSALKSG